MRATSAADEWKPTETFRQRQRWNKVDENDWRKKKYTLGKVVIIDKSNDSDERRGKNSENEGDNAGSFSILGGIV